MSDVHGYDVYLFPPALDALGEAVKPFLKDGPNGSHIACRDLDTSGVLVEMTLDVTDENGKAVEVELMVPTNMVRMVVSRLPAQAAFGFNQRPDRLQS